jgi:Zn-dependent protease with chaperone function
MGHYVLGHVVIGNFFASLILLISLYLVHRTAGGLIARYGDRFGFRELSDVASLPLLLLLLNLFTFVMMPGIMGFGRHFEHQADVFGLELTRSNRAGATAFVKLQQENLGNPRPGLLYKLWRSSHPPVGERIDFCNSYRPWARGEPLRYGDRFE